MARIDTLAHFLTDVADAIRSKTGSSGAIQASSFDTEISNIPSGGGSAEKTVFLYDYDGTVLYSYTKEEFLALSALPSIPTHTGLTSTGWNWDLSTAKTYVTTRGAVDVGCTYVTDDGKTRIYVTLTNKTLNLAVGLLVNGSLTLDWGDGSSETVTGSSVGDTSNILVPHTYSATGNYVITLSPDDASTSIVLRQYSKTISNIINNNTQEGGKDYAATITKVETGVQLKYDTRAFNYCENLEFITLPDIESFGFQNGGSFQNCLNLKALVIPKHFKSSGTDLGCCSTDLWNLKVLCLPQNVTQLYQLQKLRALKRLVLPSGITSFTGWYQFQNFDSLEEVYLPDLTSISNYAFSTCPKLKKVYFPNTLTTIGDSAFYSCASLELDEIPSSVTTLGPQPFNTSNINNPLGIKEIPQGLTYQLNSFAYTSIESFTVPSGTTDLPGNAFYHCHYLKSVSLPNTLTSIAGNAFGYCYSLSELSLPDSVATIGSNAFSNSSNLRKLNMPASLTTIGSQCFASTGIEEFVFGQNVTSIAAIAFSYCTNLKLLDFRNATSVPALGGQLGYGLPTNFTIVVPDSLYSTWKAASNWSTYSSKIVKASEYTP